MLILGIISAVLGIAGLITSIIFLSGWALATLIVGTSVLIIGGIFAILSYPLTAQWIKKTGIACLVSGGAICLIGLILVFTVGGNQPKVENTTTSISENTTTAAIAGTPSSSDLPVVDPAIEHGTYPQVQIGHPNFYVETGTNATYKWTFQVKDGEIGIVGGVNVNGIGSGVYRAYPEGTYTVQVQNGFVLTTQADWAYTEFWFRVGQAVQYGWAHGTVDTANIIAPLK